MSDCSAKSFLFILAAVAFGLNLIWELAQVFAFSSLDQASMFEVSVLVTVASVGDAVITLVAFFIVTLLRRSWHWRKSVQAADYFAFSIIGAVFATLIEMIAVSRGLWSYGDYMPIVPLLKIGLLPLLQLTILLPAALRFTRRLCRRSEDV